MFYDQNQKSQYIKDSSYNNHYRLSDIRTLENTYHYSTDIEVKTKSAILKTSEDWIEFLKSTENYCNIF